MEEFLQRIGNWPGAVLLQESGTAYLFVNAAHVLGIGLLLGAILPLDLRLLGFFRTTSVSVLGPFLIRSAATGIGLAIGTGLWLFSVKPMEYIENTAFLCKLGLLAFALLNVGLQHRGPHLAAAFSSGRTSVRVRTFACISAGLWLAVLIAGRWIAFL